MTQPQPYTLTIQKYPALDLRWFELLRELDNRTALIGLSQELFTTLGPLHDELERLREVYSHVPFNPDLRPRHVDVKALKGPLQQLEQLRQRIENEEPSAAIRQAYVAKIEEAVLHNRILIAAATHDSANFDALNLQLYGAPDKQIFAASCAWLRQYARQYANSTSPHLKTAAKRVLNATPKLLGTPRVIIPRNKVFRRIKAIHNRAGGYFEQLLGPAVLPDIVTPKHGDRALRTAIKAVGADYQIADSSDELWGVIHHAKQVVRPPDYKLPRAEFVGIIAHEVGSHLLERHNGQRLPLRLAEIGLDRYEQGNEGRAFLREQIVYDSPYDMLQQPGWEYIVLKHFAISLAFGHYRQRHTFRQVYETVQPICRFFQTLRRPDDPAHAAAAADHEAWQLCVRVLKGTDGQGGAYLKDIVYLEGNVRAWRCAARNPAIIQFGDSGKFDIANPRHLRLLGDLGVTLPVERLGWQPAIKLQHYRQPGRWQTARLTLRRRS